MAIRQSRIFVDHTEGIDWAETLIGRVFRPLVADFSGRLRWFWFSRYGCAIGTQGDDRGDCDFDAIPDEFKQALPEGNPNQPVHRSLRFRYEVADAHQAAFEARLNDLVAQHGYASSGCLTYDQIGDAGGNRFLGVENRLPGRDSQRAELVIQLFQSVSEIVMDALVGPDQANRFHIEHNDVRRDNPNASTFESLHHMFCNITYVPLSILLGTFWGPPRGYAEIDGQPIAQVFMSY
ncbi:MAG: hypothetical protein V1792_24400 [Pseudomonadota bacterium]